MNTLLQIWLLRINGKSHINVNGIRLRISTSLYLYLFNKTLTFLGNTCSERSLRIWQSLGNCGRSQHRILQNQRSAILVSAQFFRQREKNIFTVSAWGGKGRKNLAGQLVCSLCHRSLLPSYLCIEFFMFSCGSKRANTCWPTTPKNISSRELKMPLRFPMVISAINNLLFNRPCFYMNFVFTLSNH